MLRKVWIPKNIARRPAARTETYLKYGFVITECEKHLCPRCEKHSERRTELPAEILRSVRAESQLQGN